MDFKPQLFASHTPDPDLLRQQFEQAMVCLTENYKPDPDSPSVTPMALAESMQHFFTIICAIDEHTKTVNQDEIHDIANHGLRLLNELCQWAQTLDCDDAYAQLEQLSLPIALWAVHHQLELDEIDIIINAISHVANNTQDPRYLSQLAELIEKIIHSISPEIKQDTDKSDPARPWRVLNLNHGIIATRSLDPKRMEAVFEQLLYRLPDDAPGFFAEGMEQMDLIDYPDHVRAVMKTYYQLTNQPTLH